MPAPAALRRGRRSRPADARPGPRRDRRDLRALRAEKRKRRVLRLRRPAAAGAPTRSSATRRSPRASAGGSGTCSSTSSRTRRRSRSGCCAPGSEIAPTSASSATSRRRSTRSRAPTRRPLTRVRARTSPAARSSPSTATTDRRRRSSHVAEGGARPGRRRRRGRAVHSVRPDGADADRPRIRRRRRRSRRRRAGLLGSVRRGCATGTEIAVLFRTNAQSSRFEAAFARRGVPVPGAGRRRASPTGPPCKPLLDAMRGGDRAAARPRPFSEHLADLTRGTGRGDRDAESAPRRRPARAPRRARSTLGREYLRSKRGPRRVGGFVAWLDLATRSDRDPGRRRRSRSRSTAPRGSSGASCSSPASSRVSSRSRGPTAPRSRGGAPAAPCRARAEPRTSCTSRGRESARSPVARVRREPSPWLDSWSAEPRPASHPRLVDRRTALSGVRAALDAASPPQPSRECPGAR